MVSSLGYDIFLSCLAFDPMRYEYAEPSYAKLELRLSHG